MRCGGPTWDARYRTCIKAADDNQFAYGTRVALGLAEIRARELETSAVHLAVLSDNAAALIRSNIAGTHGDAALRRALGRESVVVEAGPVDQSLTFPRVNVASDSPERRA